MSELHEQQTYTVSHGDSSTFPPCPYCNGHHAATCPRLKAIEYHPNGGIRRVEFK